MTSLIMQDYLDRIESGLRQSIQVGTDLKSFDSMGKEYYAFYNTNSDTILEWVERKVKELVDTKDIFFSVVGVTFDLTDRMVFKVSNKDVNLIYVHKKRFKKYAKKAFQRNLSRG